MIHSQWLCSNLSREPPWQPMVVEKSCTKDTEGRCDQELEDDRYFQPQVRNTLTREYAVAPLAQEQVWMSTFVDSGTTCDIMRTTRQTQQQVVAGGTDGRKCSLSRSGFGTQKRPASETGTQRGEGS